jgi:hypothetical protein
VHQAPSHAALRSSSAEDAEIAEDEIISADRWEIAAIPASDSEWRTPARPYNPAMLRRAATLSVLAVLMVWGLASAQTHQGSLRGAVRDATGVIAGATVVLRHDDTLLTRETVTNDAGEYAFPNVAPGSYTLLVSLDGFKNLENSGIRIGTRELLTIDLQLEVGDVRESVVVTGGTPRLETTTASMGTLIERTSLETLPNVGRNPFVITAIAPYVLPTGSPQFVRMQDQNATAMLAPGGGPRRAGSFLIDGVSINDVFNRAALIPSLEALEEVRVQTTTYDAELGRNGGGVINTTHRAGTNQWRGTALALTRPEWGTGRLYFARKMDSPKPETHYHLWAGSFGGPIIPNRTFFWTSTEGYNTRTTGNTVLTLPTSLERSGDFSQTRDAQGRLIVIYDPLTTRPDPARPGQFIRDPFPGNVIPPERLNGVSRNLVTTLPVPTAGRALSTSSLPINDLTNQATVKVDHRFGTSQTLSGMFGWYHSKEPAPQFLGIPGDPNAIFQPRTVNVLSLNHLMVPRDRTVLALRYGFLRFRDDAASADNDASALGFAPEYLALINGIPRIQVPGYIAGSPSLFNGGHLVQSTSYSHALTGSLTHLLGRHTFKAGLDYRLLGLRVFAPEDENGMFVFGSDFTRGPDPISGTGGDSMATFLLGFPTSGFYNLSANTRLYSHYISGYVQDDVRVRDNLSVTIGLRYEFEQGWRERDDAIVVGFDADRPFPTQVAGLDLRGGLMYAGVDGYPTYQGDPSPVNFGPRLGMSWSLSPRVVVRGGYGLFWSPPQVPQAFSQAALSTRGFSASTTYVASTDNLRTPCTGCSLTNPFPRGVEQPQGSSRGLLTGAGGNVDFIDQHSRAAYTHQYSAEVQLEVVPGLVGSLGYVGNRAERLTYGGTFDAVVNLNQLDPRYQSLGSALSDPVPNPFFGNPDFGAFANQATLPRGQLLRPFPQFQGVFAHRASGGRSRYDAIGVGLERRYQAGWTARVNYTYSVRKDNLFGEGNFYSLNPGPFALDNTAIEREYGHSLLDAPHRLNLSGTFDLPFGDGKRWVTGGGVAGALVSGWTVSAIGFYQSGFPVAVPQISQNAGVFTTLQRPNVVGGVNPKIENPEYDPACVCIPWLNPAAWSVAPAFTFGNAPRTDVRVRTPFRTNWDLAIQKTQVLGRSRLTLRAEIINVFDDAAFVGPRSVFGVANFGQLFAVGGFPRTLQLQARVAW